MDVNTEKNPMATGAHNIFKESSFTPLISSLYPQSLSKEEIIFNDILRFTNSTEIIIFNKGITNYNFVYL